MNQETMLVGFWWDPESMFFIQEWDLVVTHAVQTKWAVSLSLLTYI